RTGTLAWGGSAVRWDRLTFPRPGSTVSIEAGGADAQGFSEDRVRHAGDDRARPAAPSRGRRAGSGPGSRRIAADPAAVPRAAARCVAQGGTRGELSGSGR